MTAIEGGTLTQQELAARCRVSLHTVRNWRRRGRVPCFRTIGGLPRYREELLPWLPAAGSVLLAPAEAAALLGVDPHTLARNVREGRLRAVRLPGRHFRYYLEDITAARAAGARPAAVA